MFTLDNITMLQLIDMGIDKDASDVMLKVGAKPMMKRYNEVTALDDELPVLTQESIRRLLAQIMNEKQMKVFEDKMDQDVGFTLEGKCRVRCNVYMQRGTYASVMRIVPLKIKTLQELGLPETIDVGS